MKICTCKQIALLTAICGIFVCTSLSAQTYVRYVKPEDLGTKTVYSDSVLTSIVLPKGVAKLQNYHKFNVAALELAYVMRDPSKEIMQIYVCGSASPDGLWADNVKLSQARTDAAAEYLQSALDVPSYMIYKQSLNEDWDRLYELVAESDMIYKYNVMTIIKSLNRSERKKALMELEGGRVWDILERDFFPKLRCVRFAIYCKWDPSKPYLSAPLDEYQLFAPPAPKPAPVEVPVTKEIKSQVDTIFVRDTVYIQKETLYIETPVVKEVVEPIYKQQKKQIKYWDTPWMMGFKTNLVSDALLTPNFGLEIQIANSLSLDLSGWKTENNVFNLEDKNASFYGFSPELRWWIGDDTMRKGSFIGLHARCAWYTLQWKDGLLYQNGPNDIWEGNYLDAGNTTPAWCAGLTYGYSLGLGKNKYWGLEFVVGVGYANYQQNTATYKEPIWEFVEHQDKHHFGITKASINLTYRFSLRRVKQQTIENE